MNDTQRGRADSLLLELMNSIPPDDTSVSARALRDVAHRAIQAGEFVGDRAFLLDRARQQTHAVQRKAEVERENAARHLKRRASREVIFGRRLTQELVEVLRPAVLRFRHGCFGLDVPPFSTLKTAAAWIKQHSLERWSPEVPPDHASELVDVCDRLDRVDRWHGYSCGCEPPNLEYYRADGSLAVRVVSKDSEPLASIRLWANFTAEITLLPPAALVAFMLVGLAPGERAPLPGNRSAVLPGLEVLSRRRLPNTGADQIVLALDSRELTDRNLRLLRRLALSQTTPKRTTQKQERVVEIVRQLGGPPRVRFDRGFWGRVARRLKVSDPIAAARRYYRATGGESS